VAAIIPNNTTVPSACRISALGSVAMIYAIPIYAACGAVFRRVGAMDRRVSLQSPESAVASFVFLNSGEKVALAEIRPHFFHNDDFRIGDLPEQEIGDAHLAGGADQEVGVGDVGGVEVAREKLRGDFLR
jgi:hypothetical protein